MLNSDLLRALGRRIRHSSPRLYSKLNSVRQKLIVRGRGTTAYQFLAAEQFRREVDVRGADVLEVGSDLDMSVLRLLKGWGARSAVGVNNDSRFWDALGSDEKTEGDSVRLMNVDAASLPFEDESFDHIFSVATFEHIDQMDVAVREMRRVLRPGGKVVAHYGPIWSAGRGHHVYAEVGDKEARHWKPETNPIPDHHHLLWDADEMREAIASDTAPELVEPIVEWVYDAPWINRVFQHEYLRFFEEAGFVLDSVEYACDPVDVDTMRKLTARYPGEDRFDATNVAVVLRKAPAS